MCQISTPPPGLLLVAPWQAPISWLLFTIVMLVLLRWFTQTYTYDVYQHTSHAVRPRRLPLLIATYTVLLICSFLVFLVATPSLQVLNHWFQSQLSLLSPTCENYIDQSYALNLVTAQASHAETYLGLLSSGGLIVALTCMGLYTRSRGSIREGRGQQGSSRDMPSHWNSILTLVFLIATNVVFALAPVFGAYRGCGESCGYVMALGIMPIGSVLGIPALLLTLLALTRGLVGLRKRRQWDWFVGILLLLVVSAGFCLQLLLEPGRLDPSYRYYPLYLSALWRLLNLLDPFLNLPSTALVLTVLTFLPVALLLSTLSRPKPNRV